MEGTEEQNLDMWQQIFFT